MEKNLGEIIAEKIKENYDGKIDVAVVLGSGLKDFANNFEVIKEINYDEISELPLPSTKGQVGKFIIGKIGEKVALLMLGRFHLYEGNSALTCSSLVLSLKYLNVENLILTTACGGINKKFNPADIMIINDQINLTGTSPLIELSKFDDSNKFISMLDPYDKNFIKEINKIAKANRIKVHNGTFLQVLGPQYESCAEIEAYRKLGADAVSMSTGIETIMANYLGIKVLGISCITNKTGKNASILTHDEVLLVSDLALKKINVLLTTFIKRLK